MADSVVQRPPEIIYGLADPRTGFLFYVGKTTERLYKARYNNHLLSGVKNQKTHRARKIRGIQAAGYVPEMFIIEEGCDDWVEAEQFWIAYFKSIGCRLVNATAGGEGLSGMRHSAESIEKTRRANIGSRRSDETKAKIKAGWTPERKRAHIAFCKQRKMSKSQREFLSKLHSGKTISAAHRIKIGNFFRGRKQSEAQRRNSGAGIRAAWTPERKKLQAIRMAKWQAAKTHCKRGHLLSGGNLHLKSDGRRVCKTCRLDNQRSRTLRLAR